jgi:hypothetical protein
MRLQNFFPETAERVPANTSKTFNRRIHADTERRLREMRDASPAEIERRLEALRREWDIERTLEMNAAGISLAGLALGAFVHRRFYALPAVVAGFLLQHAVQGWCPPLPLFRRLGIRTQKEIDDEIMALRMMRGDFDQAPHDPEEALNRVERN